MLKRPTSVVLLAVAVVLVATHGFKFEKGWVLKKCEGKNTTICEFIRDNGEKAVGMIIMSPVVFSLGKDMVLPVGALALIAILSIDKLSWYIYLGIAIFLQIFFNTKGANTRLAMIAILGAAYMFELYN